MFYIIHLTFLSFNGSRAILSGPAGGVVGYAMTTYQKETDLPVIGSLNFLMIYFICMYVHIKNYINLISRC